MHGASASLITAIDACRERGGIQAHGRERRRVGLADEQATSAGRSAPAVIPVRTGEPDYATIGATAGASKLFPPIVNRIALARPPG